MHRNTAEERIGFFFTCWRWRGEIANREPHKCSELGWYGPDALPTDTIPYIRHVLARIDSGVPYSSSGW